MTDCDVLIIGGGPSGCSAAYACAKQGQKTIYVDRKPDLTKPHLGGITTSRFLHPYLPFKIPEEYFIWDLSGFELWAEDLLVRREGKLWDTRILDRSRFHDYLLTRANNAGATLLADTELLSFEFGDKYVVEKAVLKSKDKTIEIKPKVVIGADGYDSTTLRLLGEYKPRKESIVEAYSMEMKNLNLLSPKYGQIFVGTFTSTGIAYVFPKSKDTAVIGVGCSKPKKPMEDYFNELLEVPEVKYQVANAEKVEFNGGKINLFRPSDKWKYGNVLITGEAANQALKPMVEGIVPGIICGDIAGKIAARHLQDGTPLDDYPLRVMNKLGDFLNHGEEASNIAYKLFEMNQPKEYLLILLLMTNIFSTEKVLESRDKEYNELREYILSWNNPQKKALAEIKERLWLDYVRLKEKKKR